MTTNGYLVQCSKCGEPLWRANKTRPATCFKCKVKHKREYSRAFAKRYRRKLDEKFGPPDLKGAAK